MEFLVSLGALMELTSPLSDQPIQGLHTAIARAFTVSMYKVPSLSNWSALIISSRCGPQNALFRFSCWLAGLSW
jgi:hypothetical protein